MMCRYMMLPVWYTLMYKAHKYGAMMLHPLEDVDDVFMVGREIVVAPVLEKEQTERTVRLPKGNWYHVQETFKITYIAESMVTVKAPLHQLPIFIKQGSIFLLYDTVKRSTKETREASNYTLLVFGERAYGEVNLDDGSSSSKSSFITFNVREGGLVIGGRFGYRTDKLIRKIVVVKRDSVVEKSVRIELNGPKTVQFE